VLQRRHHLARLGNLGEIDLGHDEARLLAAGIGRYLVAYEARTISEPKMAMIQRIAARRI